MNLETTNELPFLLPVEKMPHLKYTKESISTLKRLAELLQKRKEHLKVVAFVTDYENVENEITLIKTENELSKVHTSIIQKENHEKEFIEGCTTILKEIELKWVELMEKAKKKANNLPDLAKILTENNFNMCNDNIEFKIDFYINVRTHVYPKISPSKHLKKV